MGRLGQADEVAEAAVFLASPQSSYVTGQSLAVDGGVTARGPFPDAAGGRRMIAALGGRGDGTDGTAAR